jgi:acyl-homoserine lactone acylase PvdQ
MGLTTMTQVLARAFAFFLFLGAAACTQQADPELARLEERAARVEIVRDDFGVPHVYGKTDADAVFGLLFAQAEDDFPRIERNYVWAIGRLAEVEGESAIFSDLRARLYMTVDEARAAYASAPGWLRALCDAWADGLNYYLLTHPEVKPKLLTRFEPWMPMFFSEGSIGGDIEQIPLERIARFYGGDNAEQLIASRYRGGVCAAWRVERLCSLRRSDGIRQCLVADQSAHVVLFSRRGAYRQRGRPERLRRSDLGTVLRLPGLQREDRLDAYVDPRRLHRRIR